ncbi:unnamed protein product [Periconia digitata]|uniref:Heterokaryon incompatibility domain-containing protein n=1 Tax=Periconia digitata TaxID=1303443 RepID=A0A9W4UJ53_9PLEO|nr:unnamed protein product [Periconia digitata]
MGYIFENATMTIGAAAARDSTEGLFAPILRNPAPMRVSYHLEEGVESSQRTLNMTLRYVPSLDRTPLRYRSWVLQEKILSRRQVYFTREGLVWNCRERNEDEKGNDHPEASEIYTSWEHLIEYYSGCQLTYPTDRLIALEGLVNRIKAKRRDQYHCGVWMAQANQQIFWMRKVHGPGSENLPNLPWWSWAYRSRSKFFCHIGHAEDTTKPMIPNMRTLGTTTGTMTVDEGVMKIGEAHLMPCVTKKSDPPFGLKANVRGAHSWMMYLRRGNVAHHYTIHDDTQQLIGISALDDGVLYDNLYCISILRRKHFQNFAQRSEWELAKSHSTDDASPGEIENHAHDVGDMEQDDRKSIRLAPPAIDGYCDYFRIVLILQPVYEREGHFRRVGAGYIDEKDWEERETVYPQIYLI